MPNRETTIQDHLVRVQLLSKVGRINEQIVDNQIPVVLERLYTDIKELHDADLNQRVDRLQPYSELMIRDVALLYFMVEQRLEKYLADKEKNAPHPTFIP